jgi:anaerobic dimethyl sulfoxide reductase subunit B
MQLAFHFDQTRCIGCYTCVVACKDWNDVPAGPASWMRLKTIERGKFPHPFMAFLAVPCYHCAKPVCLAACPTGAIEKREQDGVVVVDQDLCLGKDSCDRCLKACRYKSPQFGAEPDARMQKCDFCLERWSEGKLPICVNACPTQALDAGPREVIETRYGRAHHAEGFRYDEKVEPAVVFTPKAKTMKPGVSRQGWGL